MNGTNSQTLFFPPGARVLYIADTFLQGQLGTVLSPSIDGGNENNWSWVNVRFDEPNMMLNSLGGRCDPHHGWTCDPRNLELVQPGADATAACTEISEHSLISILEGGY